MFPTRLKELRQQAGMTQQSLATAAGLSISAVREYEQGLKEPVLSNAARLAAALGCTVDDLLTNSAGEGKKAAKKPRKRKGK